MDVIVEHIIEFWKYGLVVKHDEDTGKVIVKEDSGEGSIELGERQVKTEEEAEELGLRLANWCDKNRTSSSCNLVDLLPVTPSLPEQQEQKDSLSEQEPVLPTSDHTP